MPDHLDRAWTLSLSEPKYLDGEQDRNTGTNPID